MYNIGNYPSIGGTDIGAEDEIGAVKRAVRAGLVRRQPVQPRTPYGAPVHVQQRGAREYAYQLFGLGAATLGGAGNTSLSQAFQEVFRPERLTLADSVANNSTVTGIFIGVRPQLTNLASLPASLFGATAMETRVEFDTGKPGQTFAVNITMAAAGTISGGAFGSVVK